MAFSRFQSLEGIKQLQICLMRLVSSWRELLALPDCESDAIHGLFAPASPEAEKLETTLARVRHFVGKENVGSPYLLNTHRADRFVMHPFLPPPIAGTEPTTRELRLCLRRFRPPYTAQVRLENRRPAHVSAPAMRGAIVNSRGPWRMSGNWWSEDVWNRDRWDVALDSGALYRLFQEIDSGRWFVEGSYD